MECLLFGFPGNCSNARLINFCTLYAKYFIYKHKIKGNNNSEFLGYLTKHQEKSFAPLNIVRDSL